MLAARRAPVVAPSPLEGEGKEAFQRIELGEGASSSNLFLRTKPLTHSVLVSDRAALSRRKSGLPDLRIKKDATRAGPGRVGEGAVTAVSDD
jgi:hypothetical protein